MSNQPSSRQLLLPLARVAGNRPGSTRLPQEPAGTASAKKTIPACPPRVPQTAKELNRAILLLGFRSRCDLQPGARDELRALVGSYPLPETAALWKATLKQIRKQNQAHPPEASTQG
ncbi:MAG: hypothetical protein K1Y36_25875 [Blastocatellia bacterium]|nr:hypothetical protein [Blastocatellia bacterium]